MSNNNQESSSERYKTSRVFFSIWIVIPWLILVLFAAFFTFRTLTKDEVGPIEKAIILLSLLFATAITASYHRLTVDKNKITIISFPVFYKNIYFSSIASVDEGRNVNAFKDYGFGTKIHNGAWMIGNRSGKSVDIRLNNGKQYVIVVPDDQELSNVLALTNRKALHQND